MFLDFLDNRLQTTFDVILVIDCFHRSTRWIRRGSVDLKNMQNRVFGANLFRRTIVGGGSSFATQAALELFDQFADGKTTIHRLLSHQTNVILL